LNQFRKLILYPFTFLYAIALHARHFLFNIGFFKSYQSNLKTICVGNLTFGGTGKTPHVEFLARLFSSQNKKVAIVSRGYGRKTSGLREVLISSEATEVGDEPLQMKLNVASTAINLVSEDRTTALKFLEAQSNVADLVILDDAMQHRKISCGLTILLTEYYQLFTSDMLFPSGKLRDLKSRAKSAQLIIVTKCPKVINKELVIQKMKKYSNADVFFSHIKYADEVKALFKNSTIALDTLNKKEVTIFAGIADDKAFADYLSNICTVTNRYTFKDHHSYTTDELLHLFSSIQHPIITTQKDAVKLMGMAKIPQIQSLPIYFLPIEISFDEKEKLSLTKLLYNYAR
jgi:tetraacyldisaccharide 4'-kinase